MANKYTGTKTEKNLQEAFSGESQARNKYTFFASVAKKEGYEQIAALFLKTADNEKEQRKNVVQGAHGHRRYKSKSRGRCGRRKLRVDRYV